MIVLTIIILRGLKTESFDVIVITVYVISPYNDIGVTKLQTYTTSATDWKLDKYSFMMYTIFSLNNFFLSWFMIWRAFIKENYFSTLPGYNVVLNIICSTQTNRFTEHIKVTKIISICEIYPCISCVVTIFSCLVIYSLKLRRYLTLIDIYSYVSTSFIHTTDMRMTLRKYKCKIFSPHSLPLRSLTKLLLTFSLS